MGRELIILIIVAIVTFLIRALPFLVFRGKELPKIVHDLGKVLPACIMVALVVYCLKGIDLLQGNHGLPELISVVVVVLIHLWKKNTLLSIGVGTVLYMVLVQVVFKAPL